MLRQLADRIAAQSGLPPGLLAAVVTHESGWDPRADSPVGALGLGQLMPATAKALGVKDSFDPVQNLQGAARYLKSQLDTFGSIPLALAAYNAGPGNVKKYGGVPPFPETQRYVKNILATMRAGAPMPGVLSSPLGASWGPGGPANPPLGKPKPPNPGGQSNFGSLSDLLQFAAPSDQSVSILQKLGGTAGRVAKASQAPIPTADSPGGSTLSGGSMLSLMPPPTPAPAPGQGPAAQSLPQMPLHAAISSHLAGQVAMTPGGKAPFANLKFSGHVDWQHVDPRLLSAIDHIAEMYGKKVEIISGYRDNRYSASHGGFKGDPHTRGLAVDAYIDGQPIGNVIPAAVWKKLGVRSGATANFYKGHPDPEHLDLAA